VAMGQIPRSTERISSFFLKNVRKLKITECFKKQFLVFFTLKKTLMF